MRQDGLRERLKTLQMGQTLEQFAARCDMPAPTLRRYLTGARTPEAGQLQLLAERLHVSMDWLMAGKMAGGGELSDEQIERLCDLDPEVLEVDRSDGAAVPVVRAYDDEKHHLQHWCIHCGCWHFHGRGGPDQPLVLGRGYPAGHRQAHCFVRNSPFCKNGLILDVVARLKERKDRPRSRVARVCPRCHGYYSAAYNACPCGYVGPQAKATNPEAAEMYRRLSMLSASGLVDLPPNTAIPHAQSRIVPTALVPLLGRVPAGIPERMEEAVEEWIAMPGAQADTYALKVHGESMLPELRHGDVVFFRLDREPRPGDLVVVNDEFGDSMLKRLRLKEGEWYLVSDNPAYPTVRPNGEYRIMGVVVDAWRQLTI